MGKLKLETLKFKADLAKLICKTVKPYEFTCGKYNRYWKGKFKYETYDLLVFVKYFTNNLNVVESVDIVDINNEYTQLKKIHQNYIYNKLKTK